jgi:hypothetical protein
MNLFKHDIYIQLKEQQSGIQGYFCKGYEYVDDKLYLISGNLNIRHSINDVYTYYANYILTEIAKIENKI